MFGSRRRIRHVALQVLLAWLFALGAGIVNACVLEPDLHHGIVSGGHDGHGHAPAHVQHDGHAAGAHEHPVPLGSKSPCAKFCDEPSVGAQTVKQQVDPFNAVWLGPVPSGSITVVHCAPSLGRQAVDPDLWRPAIPIPIAFLRLTL